VPELQRRPCNPPKIINVRMQPLTRTPTASSAAVPLLSPPSLSAKSLHGTLSPSLPFACPSLFNHIFFFCKHITFACLQRVSPKSVCHARRRPHLQPCQLHGNVLQRRRHRRPGMTLYVCGYTDGAFRSPMLPTTTLSALSILSSHRSLSTRRFWPDQSTSTPRTKSTSSFSLSRPLQTEPFR